ncbi:MAG: hypothetical protein Q4B99_03740, partial [Clostridia bacterium]|nr:hypothetical protein [Clostridia bacterium]
CVNDGDNYSLGKYFKLTAHICLNDTTDWELWGTADEDGNIIAPANEWIEIGRYYPFAAKFRGTFDGDGYTVSGMYINRPSDDDLALFGYCIGCTIGNVGVEQSYVNGLMDVGSIVGFAQTIHMTNCYNAGTVCGQGDPGGNGVGGLVGTCFTIARYFPSLIVNCYNTGTVSGTENVGGVVGLFSGASRILDCYNAGTVNGVYRVGGVAGVAYGGSVLDEYELDGTINCYNTGTVSGTERVGGVVGDAVYVVSYTTSCRNAGTVSGTNDVGGVVGRNGGLVTDCYNAGAVSGTSAVGGVVGHNDVPHESDPGGTTANCYNTGEVSGESEVGGVVGNNDLAYITTCYNMGPVSGTENVGGVAGYSFGSVTYCYYLDTSCGPN